VNLKPLGIAIVIAAVFSLILWFGGWFLYEQLSIWQTIKNGAYQQLLFGAIAVIISASLFFGWRGLPFQQAKTSTPVKVLRTKEQENFNLVEEKIQEMTELAGEEPTVPENSFLGNQLQRYGPEPEPTIESGTAGPKPKPKPNNSHRDVYSENKVRLHNAMVEAMIRDIDSGELKVVPSRETIEKLGLSDLKITLEAKEKKDAAPPKSSQPAPKLTRSA